MQTGLSPRVAWFAPAARRAGLTAASDHLAIVAAELARGMSIERFDARSAHHFPWQQFRTPYDLCVYELADTAAHQFVWPYLLRYPGVVVLRATTLAGARAAGLR